MRVLFRAAVVSLLVVWTIAAVGFGGVPVEAQTSRRGADYFPNVILTTHEGKQVRFYDDLIKGKIVAIDLIYTTCQYACPLETARLAQVQRILGDRMGSEIHFYSITIDPQHDTPAVLKDYAEKYHAGPGWLFLTGSAADIELISKKLGLYSEPDPNDKDGHTPSLVVGNEATGQWMRNSATDNPRFLARTIGDWLNSWQTAKKTELKSYADAPTLKLDHGQYTFATHCAACHTVGKGDQIGPDLLGVSKARNREWLTRFIVEPEKMFAERDPLALALRDKYKQVLMPSLGLNRGDAESILRYFDSQGPAAATPPPAAEPAPQGPSLDLAPVIGPYLKIQQALSEDRDHDLEDARQVMAEAAKLGSAATSIRSAADRLSRSDDLFAARIAFESLGDAIMALARTTGRPLPAGVTVAYCPMLKKYWLQTGEAIRNPYYGKSMQACGRTQKDLPAPGKQAQ